MLDGREERRMREYIGRDLFDEDGNVVGREYSGELIRCKDCKYWGEDGYHNGCKYATCIMGENDYCSMAERGKE